MDSPDQRTGSPSVGSQPCSPLADAILITPQRSVYNAVYPSCRDHDQWGHDSSCHDSVCFTVLTRFELCLTWTQIQTPHINHPLLHRRLLSRLRCILRLPPPSPLEYLLRMAGLYLFVQQWLFSSKTMAHPRRGRTLLECIRSRGKPCQEKAMTDLYVFV